MQNKILFSILCEMDTITNQNKNIFKCFKKSFDGQFVFFAITKKKHPKFIGFAQHQALFAKKKCEVNSIKLNVIK